MKASIIAAVTVLALAPALSFAAETESTSDTPLFDYATEQAPVTQPFNEPLRKQIATFEAEMARHPPPADSECAHTLGATRFARQYDDLGAAQSNAGNYTAAIEAFEKALACTPRAPEIYAELANELLHAGRLADAREAAQRGAAIDTTSAALDSILMQLDFIDEHWADTVARLRAMLGAEADESERAAYYECFLWLAQRRAGVATPELAPRKEKDVDEQWPAPLLEMLTGKRTEALVLDAIREEKNDRRRREILVEALYYVGELRLGNGQTETARRYFAAAVNLKVLYFIEHHLALAEIVKLRDRSAAAPRESVER